MKKLALLAAAALVAMMTTAHADENDIVLSFNTDLTCSKLVSDFKKSDELVKLADAEFLAGVWSGINAMDTSEAKGRVGSGMSVRMLYAEILAECKKDRSNMPLPAQNVLYHVWDSHQAKVIEQIGLTN